MFVQKSVWRGIYKVTYLYAFPGDTVVKNPPAKAGGAGLIPGLGKSPGGGNATHSSILCLGNSRKTSTSALLTMPKPLCGSQETGKFFKRWEYQTTWPASWEIWMQVKKQVRIEHGTTDWFQIGKRVRQGCILSPCLFNLYAEYIMRNAGLDGAQVRIKIAGI